MTLLSLPGAGRIDTGGRGNGLYGAGVGRGNGLYGAGAGRPYGASGLYGVEAGTPYGPGIGAIMKVKK